jgi:DnaD/phage-associated family protein
MLRNAEQDYPEEWLAEALTIAVKNNKRNWRYVEAILKRWKEQERDETQDREDSRTRGKEYTQSQFDEYLE